MVCVKDFFLPFKPHFHISRCDCLKVHRQPKRYADTRKRVSQDFAHCVEVARQLVHICSRRMPKLVEAENEGILVEVENRI